MHALLTILRQEGFVSLGQVEWGGKGGKHRIRLGAAPGNSDHQNY